MPQLSANIKTCQSFDINAPSSKIKDFGLNDDCNIAKRMRRCVLTQAKRTNEAPASRLNREMNCKRREDQDREAEDTAQKRSQRRYAGR
jgi:hypothetical protein